MRWSDSLKAVGQAYLELVRSELAALGDDLAGTGRRIGGLLALLLVAAFLLFWALGVLVYLLVEVTALWLPRWGATLVILLLLLVVVAVLALVIRRRWRRTEMPEATLRRRMEDHKRWFESRILESAGAAEGSLGEGDAVPDPREIES